MKSALLIVAGIAALVVAAATAMAGTSHRSAFLTDARAGYGNPAGVTRFVTDGRSGYSSKAQPSASHRFITDTRGGYGHPSLVAEPSAPSIGFDWGDAAVGGGVTAAILMLLGGGTIVSLRRKDRLAL
jgi:hypothetical protein